MDELSQKKCESCEGKTEPLTKEEYKPYLEKVNEWKVKNKKKITKDFEFENFEEALEFVNQVGEIAEEENHHPDILLHDWNQIKITIMTHAINGLSENDFIIASKIDQK